MPRNYLSSSISYLAQIQMITDCAIKFKTKECELKLAKSTNLNIEQSTIICVWYLMVLTKFISGFPTAYWATKSSLWQSELVILFSLWGSSRFWSGAFIIFGIYWRSTILYFNIRNPTFCRWYTNCSLFLH